MLMLDYLQECSLSPHHNLYSVELTTHSSSIIPSWFHSHSGPAWILWLTWTIIPLKPPSTSSPFSPLWNLFSKTSTRLALHHLQVLEPKHLNVTGENETILNTCSLFSVGTLLCPATLLLSSRCLFPKWPFYIFTSSLFSSPFSLLIPFHWENKIWQIGNSSSSQYQNLEAFMYLLHLLSRYSLL